MPVWRYLHTSTSEPLLDLFALIHLWQSDYNIGMSPHRHISTLTDHNNMEMCLCGDVPVWRYLHTGTLAPLLELFPTNTLVTIRIQHRHISTQAHLHMDRSQQCGDVPVWRCGDMPVWRYLHTSTSAPLLDLFALIHLWQSDYNIGMSPHRHISTLTDHNNMEMCLCIDVEMWRCACVEISPHRHVSTSPHRHISTML